MNDLISRSELLNKIGRECHYDSEHPLESYSKLLWTVCNMPTVKETQREKEMQDAWKILWHDEGIGTGGER